MTPELPLTESGPAAGRPVLVLHGGGGPATVAPIAEHFAATAHTLLPTHPGWNGTPGPTTSPTWRTSPPPTSASSESATCPTSWSSAPRSAAGSPAELATADTQGLVSGVVLVNSVGIEVEGEPIRDFFTLDARGVAEYAYHDSERFYVDPATVPAERLALFQANMAALRVFSGGPAMSDPALRPRLAAVATPTLVLWGESDRIATPAYGKEYAASFGNARFEVVPEAGHLPHLEQPARTFSLLDGFAAETGRR